MLPNRSQSEPGATKPGLVADQRSTMEFSSPGNHVMKRSSGALSGRCKTSSSPNRRYRVGSKFCRKLRVSHTQSTAAKRFGGRGCQFREPQPAQPPLGIMCRRALPACDELNGFIRDTFRSVWALGSRIIFAIDAFKKVSHSTRHARNAPAQIRSFMYKKSAGKSRFLLIGRPCWSAAVSSGVRSTMVQIGAGSGGEYSGLKWAEVPQG